MATTIPLSQSGISIPNFIYGTAWKEDRTEELVLLALQSGFRAIDTANQRKHYHEAGVGAALKRAFAAGIVRREELFIQSKFTFQAGQDHRLPYDPNADIPTQVYQSLESSLEHLGIDRLDSLLLHGPSTQPFLAEADFLAYGAMEELQKKGKTKRIGLSNVNPPQLLEFIDESEIKPAFVQNRCFARAGWDGKCREICRAHGIFYQGFSLLTANKQDAAPEKLAQICARHEKSWPQVIFCFARQMGIIPLTGTTSLNHMHEDFTHRDFTLSPEEVAYIEKVAV